MFYQALGIKNLPLFQSTLSMRRAMGLPRPDGVYTIEFQSTLSMRRAIYEGGGIMPRAHISIHALHEESDPLTDATRAQSVPFQSTLSMRRAIVQLDIFVRFLRRKPAA